MGEDGRQDPSDEPGIDEPGIDEPGIDEPGIIDLTDARIAFGAAARLRDDAEELRRQAEADADLARAETDRYVAKRLAEVQMLVDRARRSLAAAEQRSDVMLDLAREEARRLVVEAKAGRLPDEDLEELLTATTVSAAADGGVDTELDRMLASALRHALGLPDDQPYPRFRPGPIS